MNISPLWISLKVAVVATIFTFFLGLLAARWVLTLKRGRFLIDGLFSLPMVLPPTVVGFFLLLLFGVNGPMGKMLALFRTSIVFTWQGAVAAAIAVSFPIMYRASLGVLEQVDRNILYAARTLGMSELKIFLQIMLPVSRPGIAAAVILSFARALGEFGATIMLAGNIPGKTQTMSIAIYSAVQAGNRRLAYQWVAVIMAMSLAAVLFMNYWSKRGHYDGKPIR